MVGTLEEIVAGRADLQGKSLEDVFLTLTGDDAPRAP